MDSAVAPGLGYSPDRAIRARLGAIFLDGALVGLLSRLLIPALGVSTLAGAIFAGLAIQFVYFFAQEVATGQTLGKRATRLRVVSLDGTSPTLKQLAIRNALRVFDAMPMFYASGLVSVMWSGPDRRQRLGDRVADTAVILKPGGKSHRTPGWLLPTLTVSAVLLSVVLYGVAYNEYRVPDVSAEALAPPLVPGFVGDNSQAPAEGRFTAFAYINGQPALEGANRARMLRTWWIEKRCEGAACAVWLTRTVPGVGDETGRLAPGADGWRVTFPTEAFRIRCNDDGRTITVLGRAALAMQFTNGGHGVFAHEVHQYKSKDCGERTQTLDWSASLAHV